ncbi:hypothetical protein Afil01_28870 [Actinorhabdospora filicis]|uniref:Uncharacterized protein n=1 Tax=Actinorhabdospora filicis TaxID=1785913 RepID=A0A9W6WAW6_9ACTN|nr:hypothetical protein [Actinorhabdospora filicis]GLZ78080.1 hypothetical protein Afil01_28870 [Actinorhabdospora filicis]
MYPPPPPPLPRTRPPALILAVTIAYGMCAAALLANIWTIAATGAPGRPGADALYDMGADADVIDSYQSGAAVGMLLALIIIAAYILLASFVLAGRNGARVGMWILAGLDLLCSVITLMLRAPGGQAGQYIDTNAVLDAEAAARPFPLRVFDDTWILLEPALVIVIVVLLALPSVGEHLRRRTYTPPPITWQRPH